MASFTGYSKDAADDLFATTAEVSATYLTQATAASTYETATHAAAIYPTKIAAAELTPATPLYAADYDGATDATPSTVWPVLQLPGAGQGGALQTSRIAIVENGSLPGTGLAKPSGRALRFTLNPYSATNPGTTSPADGDVTDLVGAYSNRSEVYGRAPIGAMSGTPAAQWPDPVGSERWYGWSVLVPTGFTLATDTKWLLFTQWKQYHGGSPAFAMEIKRSNWRLGGTRTNSGLIPNDGTLSAITPGAWTRFVVGMKLSTDATVGWVEVWQDGVNVLPRMSIATMDTFGGAGDANADPIYLKQGIYRDTAWAVSHDMYFGPVKVGTTRASVNPLEVNETSSHALARAAALAGATVETTALPLAGGNASHGSASTASASDHVHPRRNAEPVDHALIGWAYDPILAQNASSATNGALQMVRIHVPVATTITNVILGVAVAGTTMTAGQNFAALYDTSLNLLGVTADQSTNWTTTGPKVMALASPVAVAAGDYFLAFWVRTTGTAPTFNRALSSAMSNVGLSSNFRFGTSTTALTTTAPNPAATPTANVVAWWGAFS